MFTADGSERLKLGPQIHKKLTKEYATIPLFASYTWAIHNDRLRPIIRPYYIFGKPYKWDIVTK